MSVQILSANFWASLITTRSRGGSDATEVAFKLNLSEFPIRSLKLKRNFQPVPYIS